MNKTIENNKFKLEIFQDLEPVNPREFETLGTMICFHKRYELGDKTELKTDNFMNWQHLKEYLYTEKNSLLVIPVYLYDHSGLAVNTTGFSCSWDSNQIGFIYVSKDKIREEYSCKRISKKLRESIEQMLLSEVEIYNDYLSNSVYAFSVTDKDSDEELGCGFGFYGTDFMGNGVYDYVAKFFTEQEFQEVLL